MSLRFDSLSAAIHLPYCSIGDDRNWVFNARVIESKFNATHDRCRVDCLIWSVPARSMNLSDGVRLMKTNFQSFVGYSSNDYLCFEKKIDLRLHFDGACIPCSHRHLMAVAKPFWQHRVVYPPFLYRWQNDSRYPKYLQSIEWRWPIHKSRRLEFRGIVHQSMLRRLLPNTD